MGGLQLRASLLATLYCTSPCSFFQFTALINSMKYFKYLIFVILYLYWKPSYHLPFSNNPKPNSLIKTITLQGQREPRHALVKLTEGINHSQSNTTAIKKPNILKIKDNNLPLNFQNYFAGLNQIHTIDTRGLVTGCNYRIPFYKTSQMQRSIKYKGVIVWNNISSDVRKSTFRRLKTNYKDQLVANNWWTTAGDFGWIR